MAVWQQHIAATQSGQLCLIIISCVLAKNLVLWTHAEPSHRSEGHSAYIQRYDTNLVEQVHLIHMATMGDQLYIPALCIQVD